MEDRDQHTQRSTVQTNPSQIQDMQWQPSAMPSLNLPPTQVQGKDANTWHKQDQSTLGE
jgi:hypothetical protein